MIDEQTKNIVPSFSGSTTISQFRSFSVRSLTGTCVSSVGINTVAERLLGAKYTVIP